MDMSSPGRRTRAEKGNRFPFLRQIFTSRLTRPLRKAGKCAAVRSLFACTDFAYERAWARSLFVLYTGIVLVFYGGRQNSGLVFRPSMLYRAQVRSVGRGMRRRAYGSNGRQDTRGLFSRLSALGISAEGNV